MHIVSQQILRCVWQRCNAWLAILSMTQQTLAYLFISDNDSYDVINNCQMSCCNAFWVRHHADDIQYGKTYDEQCDGCMDASMEIHIHSSTSRRSNCAQSWINYFAIYITTSDWPRAISHILSYKARLVAGTNFHLSYQHCMNIQLRIIYGAFFFSLFVAQAAAKGHFIHHFRCIKCIYLDWLRIFHY